MDKMTSKFWLERSWEILKDKWGLSEKVLGPLLKSVEDGELVLPARFCIQLFCCSLWCADMRSRLLLWLEVRQSVVLCSSSLRQSLGLDLSRWVVKQKPGSVSFKCLMSWNKHKPQCLWINLFLMNVLWCVCLCASWMGNTMEHDKELLSGSNGCFFEYSQLI